MRRILLILIRLYQWGISPFLVWLSGGVGGCRFHPTCSHYAAEAITRHGAMRGSWLAVKRLARCQPWGGSGYDPVPEPGSEHGLEKSCDCKTTHHP